MELRRSSLRCGRAAVQVGETVTSSTRAGRRLGERVCFRFRNGSVGAHVACARACAVGLGEGAGHETQCKTMHHSELRCGALLCQCPSACIALYPPSAVGIQACQSLAGPCHPLTHRLVSILPLPCCMYACMMGMDCCFLCRCAQFCRADAASELARGTATCMRCVLML